MFHVFLPLRFATPTSSELATRLEKRYFKALSLCRCNDDLKTDIFIRGSVAGVFNGRRYSRSRSALCAWPSRSKTG
ncbi:unnamed protein product [Protopolystoma xenopodis]|uniref:Uncharacterized protein n=1 Tax=Protopolystoma xenopodis TaxID=117903 RepID=A0A3S5CMV9_9PLAT|nr:unnamed protein product [Protopolystoma xenopodis]